MTQAGVVPAFPEGSIVKMAVEFPTNPLRLGDDATLTLAREIEALGYDQIDLMDHVTVGLPTPGREETRAAASEILEPLVTLGALAATTSRIGLGTGVLILPQRQPALVAKQVATLDVLSRGRMRLGVGVGWQESEYDSLGVPFRERGRRMDEGITLIRRYWTEPSVTFAGAFYRAEAMAMEPKPVQPGGPPIWIGGESDAALRRVGRLGDGWLAMFNSDEVAATAPANIATIRAAAEDAGRDPATIGLQVRLTDAHDLDVIPARVEALRELGFGWLTINMEILEAAGVRGVDAQIEMLGRIRERVLATAGAGVS
jgi:probable F420-dependent oxidoreductase